MLKIINKKYIGFGALALVIGLMAVTGTVNAAADTVLVDAIASSTGFFTDNAAVLVTFIVEVVLKLSGIALAFGAVYWVYRKIRSIFYK